MNMRTTRASAGTVLIAAALLMTVASGSGCSLLRPLTFGLIDTGEPLKMTYQSIGGRLVDVYLDGDGTVWYAGAYGGREIVATGISRSTKKGEYMSVGGSSRDTFMSPDDSQWYISDSGSLTYIKYPRTSKSDSESTGSKSKPTVKTVDVDIVAKPVPVQIKD